MTSRHSSGSSCVAMLVEFTKSQNSTVRWRRCPSVDVAMTGAFAAPAELPSSSATPQSPQKCLPLGFSLPHLKQRMGSPVAQRLAPHLSPCWGRDHYSARVNSTDARGRNLWLWRGGVVIRRSPEMPVRDESAYPETPKSYEPGWKIPQAGLRTAA